MQVIVILKNIEPRTYVFSDEYSSKVIDALNALATTEAFEAFREKQV